MLQLLFSKDERFKRNLASWVTKRLFMIRQLREGDYEIIAVAKVNPGVDSTIIAGALFHDYAPMGDGAKIEVSMAAEDPKWATKNIIRGILAYPFLTLNCHVLIATTNRTNKRTRRFLAGIGFEERGTIPNRPHADDTIIYCMRKETAMEKWFKEKSRKIAA